MVRNYNMKPKEITWIKSDVYMDQYTGIINNKYWFKIEKRGVRKVKFVLFSYPIFHSSFPKSINMKNLGEFNSLEIAQKIAKDTFNDFVNGLIQ